MALVQLKAQDLTKQDLIVTPFKQGPKKPLALTHFKLPKEVETPLQIGDFQAKVGETLLIYHAKRRYLLLGLGEESTLTEEDIRRAYGKAYSVSQRYKCKKVAVYFPASTKPEQKVAEAIVEGFFLKSHGAQKLHTQTGKQTVGILGIAPHLLKEMKKKEKVLKGVFFARDLVNANADRVTPEHLLEHAASIAEKNPLVTNLSMEDQQLEKEGLSLIRLVGRASRHAPAMILLHYQGAPASQAPIALLGKGVTYDTGGLNLKPGMGMNTMRADMAGGATIFGVFQSLQHLKLPLNIIGCVPAAENAINEQAYKPGDVYSSYSGKTIEIGSTDAEGRLLLADALSYVYKHYKPSHCVDLATLTGVAHHSLGYEYAACFANDPQLEKSLLNAGEEVHERLISFPLCEEYREFLRSDFADLCNTSKRFKLFGSALFLREFVPKKSSWAHLDIAGTAFVDKEREYLPSHATGYGVRLLLSFLQKMVKN